MISRAKDMYLYDLDGNRFLDLYLENGKLLFGHRPKNLGKY